MYVITPNKNKHNDEYGFKRVINYLQSNAT